MSSQTEFVMRPFSPDADLPRLARLFALNRGFSPQDSNWIPTLEAIEKTQRLYMKADYHDPAKDRFVIDSPDNPDEIIGYATAWAKGFEAVRTEIYVAVHPEWRQQGLGRQLLLRAIEQAREQGTQYACMQADADNDEDCHAFIQANGFRLEGASYFSLRMGADIEVEEAIFPDGFHLKTYAEVNDIEVYSKVINRAYGDLWGHHRATAEAQQNWIGYFDPMAIFILFGPHDEAIGMVRVQHHTREHVQGGQNRDSVDAPGVIPNYREQGLYRPLLLTGIKWLREHGAVGEIMMDSWGDLPETVAMFQEVGFETMYESVAYRLEL